MSEFSNLINTLSAHVTAENVETFTIFVERLITLGESVASGSISPVVATVDALTDVSSVVSTTSADTTISPSNPA